MYKLRTFVSIAKKFNYGKSYISFTPLTTYSCIAVFKGIRDICLLGFLFKYVPQIYLQIQYQLRWNVF